MDHIAIMKKEWGLIPKILSGEKTVESRWYKNKVCPWNKVFVGDTLYFKNSGEEITVKAAVTRVEQLEVTSNNRALEIMSQRAKADLGTTAIPESVIGYISNKRYAVFIYFNEVQKVEPFDIDKRGFGAQCAWIACKNVSTMIKTAQRST